MRRVATALGAGGVLLLSAACAGQQDVGFGGQPPATQQPPPATPIPAKPPDQRTPVPQDQVQRDRTGSGPKKVSTQDGGTVVVTRGREGGCSHVHAETTAQDARSVTVTLVEQQPEAAKVCTMDLRYPPVTAPLAQPLGQRTVVLHHKEVKVPR